MTIIMDYKSGFMDINSTSKLDKTNKRLPMLLSRNSVIFDLVELTEINSIYLIALSSAAKTLR